MNTHLKIGGILFLTLGTIWILPEGTKLIDPHALIAAILGFLLALAITKEY